MSAGSISLESSIRTCKVDTSYANKVQSDRILNTNNLVCPVFSGRDLTGRQVCADSFYTKSAGCNSASDRVVVENSVSRPQYFEYITLNPGGVQGNIYNNIPVHNSKMRSSDLKSVHEITGQYGNQFGANVVPPCGVNAYDRALNQELKRKEGYAKSSYHSYNQKRHSGF